MRPVPQQERGIGRRRHNLRNRKLNMPILAFLRAIKAKYAAQATVPRIESPHQMIILLCHHG
jgi:hypothetical protein